MTGTTRFGGAPHIQYAEGTRSSIDGYRALAADIRLIERLLGIGFFYYGPPLWRVGLDIDPLEKLLDPKERRSIFDRILAQYPTRVVEESYEFFRVRVNPTSPAHTGEFDSPPTECTGQGRLDTIDSPVLYASPDLEVCLHETRVTAEDAVYAATLKPSQSLRLLDLVAEPVSDGGTPFESLATAIHMLFGGGADAYDATRAIAAATRSAGFDGLVYPSFFSALRLGDGGFTSPFPAIDRQTVRFAGQDRLLVPNLAVFGRPVADGRVVVECINRIVLTEVRYGFRFGPVER